MARAASPGALPLPAGQRLVAQSVEGFFGILGKPSLSLIDFHSPRALRAHLEAFMRAWNHNPTRSHGPNRRARLSAHTVA